MVCLQAVYNLDNRKRSSQGGCGADTFYPFTACNYTDIHIILGTGWIEASAHNLVLFIFLTITILICTELLHTKYLRYKSSLFSLNLFRVPNFQLVLEVDFPLASI